MKRTIAMFSLLAAILIAAPLATAMLPTPSGLPSKGITIGEGIDIGGLIRGGGAAPTHAHMNDGFGYCWDLDISVSGGVATFTGTCNVGGVLWSASGTYNTATQSISLTAVNPNPDNCQTMSGSFTYTGTGKKTQSGTWVNDCGLSGSWQGRWAAGSC